MTGCVTRASIACIDFRSLSLNQAMHVRPQREPLRAMAEAALKRFEPANQSLNARRRGAIDHRASAYRTHATGTRYGCINSGKGEKYTRSRLPVSLVYTEP